jgi:hypothetical protein
VLHIHQFHQSHHYQISNNPIHTTKISLQIKHCFQVNSIVQSIVVVQLHFKIITHSVSFVDKIAQAEIFIDEKLYS